MNHALGHIGLRVPDLDASIEYAVAVLGVEVVEQDGESARLALPGQPACLLLRLGDDAGLDHMTLVTDGANLAEIISRARARELAVCDAQELPNGIRLHAPNHLAIEIGVGPPPSPSTVTRDIGPPIRTLDHVSLNARDLAATVMFFQNVLGFRLSDSVDDQRHWLRCNANHHTVAIFAGEDTLHHYAFQTADIGGLQRLGDLLATRGQNFLWGPGRHALGANLFTYQLDPSGAILEVCCDMIQVLDEDAWVKQVWPGDTLDSAVMWGPPPPPGFREITIPIRAHEAIGR